jgi:uncharacterized membrane protein
MVVATMPRLGHDLGIAPTTAVWLLLAGSAATAGLMLPAGRWADVTAKRMAFLIGSGGYALAAGMAAAAPTVSWLIAARALQGAFNALLMVLVITVAVEAAGPGRRAVAVALITAIGPFANMTGPQVAALILPVYGWRSIFLIGVPLPLIAAAFAWVALPRDGGITRPRFRWLIEAVALTVAIASLFLVLRQLPGRAILPAAGLALLCVVGTAIWIRLPQAHGIFRLVAARRLGSPLAGLAAMALTAGVVAFVIPYFLLVVVGASLQATGLIFITLAFCQTLASIGGGYAIARWGGWPIALAGAGIMAAGSLALLPLDPRWGALGIAVRIGVIGIGTGLVGSSNQSTVRHFGSLSHLELRSWRGAGVDTHSARADSGGWTARGGGGRVRTGHRSDRGGSKGADRNDAAERPRSSSDPTSAPRADAPPRWSGSRSGASAVHRARAPAQ